MRGVLVSKLSVSLGVTSDNYVSMVTNEPIKFSPDKGVALTSSLLTLVSTGVRTFWKIYRGLFLPGFYFRYEAKALKLILTFFLQYKSHHQNVKIKTCKNLINKYFSNRKN